MSGSDVQITPALSFAAATVGYGTAAVIRDASLEVYPGSVVGLIGPNGAGKSTLLKAVLGEADLLGGEISLLGADVGSYTHRSRAQVLAVVPQSVTAPYAMTVGEFVSLGRSAHRDRFAPFGPADRAALERVLALTDTDYLADKMVGELSGGELQRAAVAQALVSEPQVLILDEPTNHLDLRHRLALLNLVRALADDGLAVLGVFHDFDLAARYADEIAVVVPVEMVGGRIVSDVMPPARPEEVLSEEMVRSVFAVDAKVFDDLETGRRIVIPRA